MPPSATVVAASQNGGSSTGTVIFLAVLVLAVLLLVVARRRSRTRMAARMEQSFVLGAEVVNRAGTIGVLRRIDDDEVLVEVAPGVEVRMLRSGVFPRSAAPGSSIAPEESGPDETGPDATDDRGPAPGP